MALRALWIEYHLLLLPEQEVNDEQHVAFSRRFGEPEIFPQSDNRSSTLPEILRISNVDEEGNILPVESETVQFLGLTWLWHTDSSFRPIPAWARSCTASR